MYVQKKKRKVIRAQITHFAKEADELLGATSAVSLEEVSALIKRLQLAEQQLKNVDAAIEPHLKKENVESEFETILEYRDKMTTYMGKLEYRMKLCSQQTETKSTSQNERTIQAAPATRIQRTKLPRLELLRFDRRRKNWQSGAK